MDTKPQSLENPDSQSQSDDQPQSQLVLLPPPNTASISLSLSKLLPVDFLIPARFKPNPLLLSPHSKVKIPFQIPSALTLSHSTSLPSSSKPFFKSTISSNPLHNPLSINPRRPSDPSNGAALRRASIVWFRNDLRVFDNESLNSANNESMSVLPVYCFDPRDYGKSSSGFDKTGPYRASFLIESVSDLRKNLQARGSDLIVRIGKPETVLVELVKEVGAEAVYAHREVSHDEVKGEQKIETVMKDEGVEVKYFWGSTLYHLEDLPFKLEEMPTNYGGFREKVQRLEVRKTIEALDQLRGLPSGGNVEPGEIPSLVDLGLNPSATMGQSVKSTLGAYQRGKMKCYLSRHSSLATPTLFWAPERRKHGVLRATSLNFGESNDTDAAITRASLRLQESLRPEPLFVDPYAGCFAPPDEGMDMGSERHRHPYCLGTKYIDDKLVSLTKNVDGPKQVVLLSDGMDTRAYRISWPTSTVIYDISPERMFKGTAQKLQDIEAKIARNCLLLHVPLESSDIQQNLRDKGFSGSKPSVWVLQGLPVTNLTNLKEILFVVSNLAMKGCYLLGEFPTWLTETEIGNKDTKERWMDKLFISYGFRVKVIKYNEVAKGLGKLPVSEEYNNVLFVADQLRFSDDQVETWRREFQRIEDEGDEDGFEEL